MRRLSHRWIVGLIGIGMWIGTSANAEDSASSPSPAAGPVFTDQALEFFEKEVRPILTARCTECHGAGTGDPKGGLSLTSRSAALKGGDTGPAVVPGKIKESLLVSAIEYGDLYQMPPKSKLPAKEIAVLTKWVELGAPWPKEAQSAAGTVKPFDLAARKSEHWCWQPVGNPPVPRVKDAAWPKTNVDRFILAALETKGLRPAEPASKATLIRRAYFDVIGLPPSPEEVAAFVNDASPQAFEHVVDRLLDSEHFGERWARHWLDLVRYAETRGHEFEPIIPNAWQYRDYVIRALNADVSYDRFLLEHIAGDLIEPRWRAPMKSPLDAAKSPNVPRINESVLGTGFWFLGEEVHSPVDIRKDETDRMDNRLDVMSKTFLGLTVACARCHDHKFDAISQRDYYAMTGYLISGSYRQVRVQTGEQDRQIATRLEELRLAARQEISQRIVNGAKPTLDKLNQYLMAARQAVNDGLVAETPAGSRPNEVLFADFEGTSYGTWKTEGTAFGDRPPRKPDNIYEAPLEGYLGDRLVNSHRNAITGANNAGTRDAQTGRLISPQFTIERNAIRFLIGGGAHAGKTCMNLEVDGRIVRTATGQNSGTLRSEQWQVADLIGKQARIEIVDADSGGWGHILVDQIVFSNDASTSNKPARQLAASSREKLDPIAASQKLDPDLLSRWSLELLLAKSDRNHALHGFLANVPAPRATPANPDIAENSPNQIVDFGAPEPGQSISDGVSFGLQPVRAGQLQLPQQPGRTDLHVATVGGWERDLFWKELRLAPGTEDDHAGLGSWHRHGRMIRSPEFTLNGDRLWYLVRGSVRAYVSVNSHLVVAGPLHGSVLREFKHADDQWHWVAHGLELYKGHRMHVEFCPGDDNGCCVAQVWQGAEPPKVPNSTPLLMESPAGTGAGATGAEEVARAIQSRLQGAMAGWPQQSRRADYTIINWLVEHKSLLLPDAELRAIEQRLTVLGKEEAKLASQVRWESELAPAMLDGNGINEHLLVRGNSSTPRDAVPRRILEAFDSADAIKPDPGSGRLTLAHQMLQSPLAARVAVNRIWHHLFGRGIVPSVDNMGVLGQAPTHPELLDYLASDFSRQGWSTKQLIKSLLLSQTYQMSSKPSEPAESADPDNLLWHRMPIKRLEGEVIRDALLAVSGRLDRTPYGPSVPIHLTPFMEGRGRPGVNGPLDGNGRRSIYIAVRRNFLSPMMLAFDTPSPFSTVGRRTTSNVPAQALILMNDPLVIELAKRWADQLLKDPTQSPEQRLDAMYLTALSRRATDGEKAEAIAFLQSQSARLGTAEPGRPASPQAWSDLCHVLFNVKEFVFIE
jgi:hypothetical protein